MKLNRFSLLVLLFSFYPILLYSAARCKRSLEEACEERLIKRRRTLRPLFMKFKATQDSEDDIFQKRCEVIIKLRPEGIIYIPPKIVESSRFFETGLEDGLFKEGEFSIDSFPLGSALSMNGLEVLEDNWEFLTRDRGVLKEDLTDDDFLSALHVVNALEITLRSKSDKRSVQDGLAYELLKMKKASLIFKSPDIDQRATENALKRLFLKYLDTNKEQFNHYRGKHRANSQKWFDSAVKSVRDHIDNIIDYPDTWDIGKADLSRNIKKRLWFDVDRLKFSIYELQDLGIKFSTAVDLYGAKTMDLSEYRLKDGRGIETIPGIDTVDEVVMHKKKRPKLPVTGSVCSVM